MAHISRFGWFDHLRAQPNQYILHYRKGKLVAEGAGLAYWFNPLTAAVAMVPVEDCEATYLHNERTRDLQEVSVQIVINYRFARPYLAASRLNFSLDLRSGVWVEQPLEKLVAFWSSRTLGPTREYLAGVTLGEAISQGAQRVSDAVRMALAGDDQIASMGLAVVGVQVVSVAPTAELEKALQTPTREALQQKADEAVFARRALAVEKERAIRENELATQIELARRNEALIEQNGANKMREVRQVAEAERAKAEAQAQRETLLAEAEAGQARIKAEGKAAAIRLTEDAIAEGDRKRVEVWEKASGRTLMGLALQELAKHIQEIGHLNITPNLLGDAFQKMLQEEVN